MSRSSKHIIIPEESDISELIDKIQKAYSLHRSPLVFTVGISGIDASGKGWLTKNLEEALTAIGFSVVNINIDPWQQPMAVRLKTEDAARSFYENAISWDKFLGELVIPLQQQGSIHLDATLIRTDADVYYEHTYSFNSIDILLIEGILLFRQELLKHFHYRIWVESTFEAAMKRALRRNVEQLSVQDLQKAYETWYYPAQRLHFSIDDPKSKADVIFNNEGV